MSEPYPERDEKENEPNPDAYLTVQVYLPTFRDAFLTGYLTEQMRLNDLFFIPLLFKIIAEISLQNILSESHIISR